MGANPFSRQGAVRGRAAWPRLRRHLADKLGLPLPKTIGEPHSGRRAATLRLLAGKIRHTMFLGTYREYGWSESTTQPNVMMCTHLAARPAAGGAAGFSGFCICISSRNLFCWTILLTPTKWSC